MELSDSRLKYLYEAHRRGTMRAASEYFNVAPSSISRQISGLEKELGLTLVEKGRHTVKLTEAGQLLVEYFHERMGSNEALLAALDDVRGMRAGHLRIATGQSLINTILARVIAKYRAHWPGMRIHVTEVATQEVLSLLSQDEVHFGILLNPPTDPLLRSRLSFTQSLQAVMTPDHPLARQASVSLNDVLKHSLILLTNNFRSRQLLEEIAIAQRLVLDPVMTVSSSHMLLSCVRAGVGIGLFPNLHVGHELGIEHLVSLPIDNDVLTAFEVHAMVRIGRTLPKSVNVFLDMLEREIAVSARLPKR
jgi:DNA-binding transcriptional LysR family regulator